MLNKWYLVLLMVFLISCDQSSRKEMSNTEKQVSSNESDTNNIEKFQEINFNYLNKILSQKTEKLSVRQIMNIYYPININNEEGNQIITIQERNLDNGTIEVELIHDNQLDDSIKAVKHLMILNNEGGNWEVISLKKNWKCWDGRGHTNWNIELCN